ncbi:MAG TPA: ribosomal protein S18-alanine N-acetyltransferase [Gemmatimonadaceae bacterium]|jgi:ribosomal-protein-alanine N-acetyltransferase
MPDSSPPPTDTPTSVHLRPVRDGDLDRIAEIERASFTDPWSRPSFAQLLRDRRVHFIVACTPDGIIRGYAVAWFVLDEGEIANIAVQPDCRGQGIGRTLLRSVTEAAAARRASALYLEVRDSNASARAMYSAHGFVQVGRRNRYYRRPVEDALVLRLALPARG